MADFGSSKESSNGGKKTPVVDISSDEEADPDFPTTLEGFGYKFEDGRLRHIETGDAFEFEVEKNDHSYNQKRYEALGEVVTKYVYNYIMQEGNLKKMHVPIDAPSNTPTTFIFHSEDAFVNSKILILIHGSGVVRAGQWARRLIINDCLDSGTQLPFINRARGLGYGVFVLNTNDNARMINGSVTKIPQNGNPDAHANYVMTNIILKKAAAKHIAIVAHSYGGAVAVNMISKFKEHLNKFFALAFTDSSHSVHMQVPADQTKVREWFKKNAKNWVSSHQSLDAVISQGGRGKVECVSAGTQRHDLTSWSSFTSIFEFFDQKYRENVASRKN